MNRETPSKRAPTITHCLLSGAQLLLYRCGLLALLLLGLSVATVTAAVVLISFEATPQGDAILITWETASEINIDGFHIQRAPYVTPAITNCTEIPDLSRINTTLIPSTGDIIGDSYVYTDTNVVAGSYYYCLEAVETDGSRELHGPTSATLSWPFSTYLPLVLRETVAADSGSATTVEIWSKPGIIRMYER